MFIDRNFVPHDMPAEGKQRRFWFPQPLLRPLATLVAGLGLSIILFFLILPTVIIIPMSLSTAAHLQFPPDGVTLAWYKAFFSDPDWMGAVWFSLRIALATCLAATVTGTLAALVLVRGDLPFKGVLRAVSLGPMIIPHIVLGVALYLVFSPMRLTGTLTGFLIAHTVLAVPFVIITVTASLQQLDVSLDLAAQNCGANRAQSFFHVTLPNIAPGIVSGILFSFLASFDEATVAFFISDVGGKSIGRKMFEDIDFNLTPIIAAASTVTVLISLLLIALVHLWSQADAKTKPKGAPTS